MTFNEDDYQPGNMARINESMEQRTFNQELSEHTSEPGHAVWHSGHATFTNENPSYYMYNLPIEQ